MSCTASVQCHDIRSGLSSCQCLAGACLRYLNYARGPATQAADGRARGNQSPVSRHLPFSCSSPRGPRVHTGSPSHPGIPLQGTKSPHNWGPRNGPLRCMCASVCPRWPGVTVLHSSQSPVLCPAEAMAEKTGRWWAKGQGSAWMGGREGKASTEHRGGEGELGGGESWFVAEGAQA